MGSSKESQPHLENSPQSVSEETLSGKADIATALSGAATSAVAEFPVDELARLRLTVRRLEEELERLAAEKQRLSEVQSAILSSRSWKLLESLRRIRRLGARVWPPIRMRTVRARLTAGRNVRELPGQEGYFRLEGPSPTLPLYFEEPLPGGPVYVQATLEGPANHLYVYLYWDDGSGFQGEKRALILLEKGRQSTVLVRLPEACRALRIDPFETKGEFKLSSVSFRELGMLQVFGYLWATHIGPLLLKPAQLAAKIKKGLALFKSGGFLALRIRLFTDELSNNYQEWLRRFDEFHETDHEQGRRAAAALEHQPLISVLMPVYNVAPRYLRRAIKSVQEQWYPHWELCIADDASSDPSIREIIREYAAEDERIRFVFREENGHISAASNSALALAQGEFVSLLDHDDELRPHALYMIAERLQREPDLQFLYSDEDKMTAEGLCFNPYFKSSWNPILLWSQNYVCHLTTVRTERLRACGGFREGVEGAQDWDMILRVTEGLERERIAHIPHVLYHWRVIEGSTAQATDHKPYVLEAQRRAVQDHLDRIGVQGAEVAIRHDISQLRVHLPLPDPAPLVTLIMPTRDRLALTRQCVTSVLEKTSYPNFELLIVDNGSIEKETLAYFASLEHDPRVHILRDEGSFNYSRLNNRAVAMARGSYVGLINNDLEVIEPRWLDELVSYAVLPGVGAVGARLLYPNDLLQHGGVILGIGGVAGHSHKGISASNPGTFNRAILPQNLSAVTAACLVIRKETFVQCGGLDEGALAVAFNDVDFCLRVRSAGYENIYNPYALLYHHESASRGHETTPEKFQRFEEEIEVMKRRWGPLLAEDPYYNPNLTLTNEDFSYSFPPRTVKTWKESA